MKKRAAALAAAVALLLAGCAGPSSGEVHDKSYRAGYTSFTYICSKTCTPIPMYNPPSWSLDIYASADNHGWISVDETTYHEYEIGDHYPKSGAQR